MIKKKVTTGMVHQLPGDIRKTLASVPKAQIAWDDITPLARNEWICWVESAKKDETRERRVRIMMENLGAGKRRPCCWAGCPHR